MALSRVRVVLVGVLMFLLIAGTSLAAIPPAFQAVLVKRILAYDTTLKSQPKIVVLYAGGREAEALKLVDEFNKIGLQAIQEPAEPLRTSIEDNTILVLLSVKPPRGFKELCLSTRSLSVATEAALVEAGEVSIGLGTKSDGRPQIFVNLSRLKAEGHEVKAALLALAKVLG